jgi:CBS domain-containing protein
VVAGVQGGEHPEAAAATGAGVGARMEKLTVSDAMIRDVLTANADDDIAAAARLLVEHRIHRLPVVEGGTLVGIVTSLDLVGLIADARLRGD